MRRVALALPVAWLMAWAAPTLAQDDTQRAVILFEESETAYNAGQFSQAAALLRRAHALHPDPTLLFNLARALEGDGDLDGAIEAYQRYAEEAPDAPDRGAVEARVQTLRTQRDRLESNEEPVEEPQPDVERRPEDAPGSSPRLGGWLVAAGGLAIVGGAVGLGVASRNRADDADAEPVQERAKSLHDEAQTRATLANVFFVVGGVAMVAGVVWGILTLSSGSSSADDDTQVGVGPGTLHLRHRF